MTRVFGAEDALSLVAEEMAACEAALKQLLHSDVAAVPAVAGYLVDAGGKRLRPALTALGCRAVGWKGDVPRLMAVGELIHLGSLLHDDVVDEGVMRRGRSAAHRVYGNAVSVLSGDFCLARAVLLAAETGGHRAVTALAEAVTRMAEGEVLQLRYVADLTSTREAYHDVVDRKSAALIAWCASAGALAADEPNAADALRRFGRAAGRAFQITDDVLDYAEGTGKTRGNDLRERKATLPLLIAIERDPSLVNAVLAPEADVQALLTAVARTGALEAALEEARALARVAAEALRLLPPSDARDALFALGRHLVERAS